MDSGNAAPVALHCHGNTPPERHGSSPEGWKIPFVIKRLGQIATSVMQVHRALPEPTEAGIWEGRLP